MRYLWGTLSVLLMVGGLVGATAVVRRSNEHKLVASAAAIATRPGDYEYQKADGSKLRDFDVSFDLTLGQPQDSARVLVNVQRPQTANEGPYDNAYYVDLSGRGLTVGSFEGGLPRVLGEASSNDLTSGKTHRVVVKRRTPWLTVVVDERAAAMVQDETHTFGTMAFGLAGAQSRIEGVKVLPMASLYFSDNFMQDEAEKSHWTALRGDWEVVVLNDPVMSVDAFNYRAKSQRTSEKTEEGEQEVASSVTGEMFWDNYAFSAAVKSKDGETIGLLAYYRSEKNYYLFSWDRRDGAEPTKSLKRLIKMHNGAKTVLAESAGGFIPNQYYTLTAEVEGRTIRASIDGNPVFAVEDDDLVGGMIGLYAAKTVDTRFDDVLVRSVTSYTDEMKRFPGGRWTVLGGNWKAEPTVVGSGSLAAEGNGKPARCVTGSSLWQNYEVRTEMEPRGAARSGVDLYYTDERTYYAATCERAPEGDRWRLVSHRGGTETVLAETKTARHEERYRIQATANRGKLTLKVDAKTLIEAFDLGLPAGSVGLWSEGAAAEPGGNGGRVQTLARFTGLTVDFLREQTPLVTKNIIMEHERTMGEWSGLVTDWVTERDDARRILQWNRGYFPGSSTLEVQMSEFKQAGSTATLVLNADEETVTSGYRLEVGPKKPDSKEMDRALVLYRMNQEVARTDLGSVQPGSVRLERAGGLLVGYVDGRGVIWWRDESPLAGDRLGWNVNQAKVNPDDVLVSSPNVYQYLFTQAPADWRSSGGIWEVSSRWQCDPRWSFFSGRVREDAAALWSKRLFNGDVTVEYYVGPKMDQERGRAYEYARDFNVTIAADGKDLTTGYSFLIGGFDNAKTCVYRQMKLMSNENKQAANVPREQTVIPRGGGLHRQWLHVCAQKKGDMVRLWFERKLVVEFKDPEPLTGNRIAFWTKDCGFMLGKVVISCEDARQTESPDIQVAPLSRSIYDPVAGAMLPGYRTFAPAN